MPPYSIPEVCSAESHLCFIVKFWHFVAALCQLFSKLLWPSSECALFSEAFQYSFQQALQTAFYVMTLPHYCEYLLLMLFLKLLFLFFSTVFSSPPSKLMFSSFAMTFSYWSQHASLFVKFIIKLLTLGHLVEELNFTELKRLSVSIKRVVQSAVGFPFFFSIHCVIAIQTDLTHEWWRNVVGHCFYLYNHYLKERRKSCKLLNVFIQVMNINVFEYNSSFRQNVFWWKEQYSDCFNLTVNKQSHDKNILFNTTSKPE